MRKADNFKNAPFPERVVMDGVSVIIPIYNSSISICSTLDSIEKSIVNAQTLNCEVIIVNDGSTDDLETVINQYRNKSTLEIKLQSQINSGRILARRNGLKSAKFENIIYIDSRVEMSLHAMQNLSHFLEFNPKCSCAIATIDYADELPVVSYFWEALERLAWYQFYASNDNIELTKENFNQMPKGTTMIYFKKLQLEALYQELELMMNFDQNTNDDTLLINEFIETQNAVIVRNFRATYHPRTKFKKFAVHAFQRGKVALGGYFGSGNNSRLYAVTFLLFSSFILLSTILINPILLIVEYLFALGLVFGLSIKRKLPMRAIRSLLIFAPIFVCLYFGGVVVGRLEVLSKKLKSS